MKVLAYVFLLTICGTCVNAQSYTNVFGLLVDTLGQPLSNTTLSVFQDQQVKAYALSDENGNFHIKYHFAKNTKLKISLLGYEIKWIDLAAQPIDQKLDTIVLTPDNNQLKVVTVIGKRNLIQQNIDRVTYDVKNDPEKETATSFDILRKVPLVAMGLKDEIMVNGRESFTVLINGKPSSILGRDPATILKNLPAARLKRIDVITTPASRFSQNGVTEIIDIITVDKNFKGFQTNSRVTYTSQDYFDGNLTSEFKSGKWGVTNYLNYLYMHPPSIAIKNRIHNTDGVLDQIGETRRSYRRFTNIPEISYEIDSLSFLQASFEWSKQSGNEYSHINNNYHEYDQPNSIVKLRSTHNGFDRVFKAYFQRHGKENPNRLLTLGYGYSISPKTTKDTVMNEYEIERLGFLQLNETESKEQTIQIDYAHPLKNIIWESGLKLIFRDNQSKGNYYSLPIYQDQGITQSDETELQNQQDVYSGYQSLYFQTKTWGLKSILKVELTEIVTSQHLNQYLNFLPSISFQKKLNFGLFTFDYDVAIERPSIWQLNNFLNLSNPNFPILGNPNLRPSTLHNLDLSMRINSSNFYKLSLYAELSRNGINSVQELRNDTTVVNTFKNIGKRTEVGLKSSVNYQVLKGLDINFNGRLGYVAYNKITNGTNGNRGVEFYTTLGTSYLIKGGYRVSTYFRASNPYVRPQGKTFWWIDHSVGIRKDYFNDRLNANISFSNPFMRLRNRRSDTVEQTFSSERLTTEVVNEFRCSFAYRFGSMKAGIKKSSKQISNSDVRTQPSN